MNLIRHRFFLSHHHHLLFHCQLGVFSALHIDTVFSRSLCLSHRLDICACYNLRTNIAAREVLRCGNYFSRVARRAEAPVLMADPFVFPASRRSSPISGSMIKTFSDFLDLSQYLRAHRWPDCKSSISGKSLRSRSEDRSEPEATPHARTRVNSNDTH
ncbi:hypothetical protein EV421DRAFT_136968 [Armillaria borealis]|uniref:Uncharacterized protein n=1 Tax=Armillaria borealis TaxID=47425 RepID=A0AA39IY75_9AGAR|nr:hypothetical protein EV421DRAFT_136968 [Armillaria borealis]